MQADLRGTMRGDDEVDALRSRVAAAEDLLSQLQGRLSMTEVALIDAKMQAEVQAREQAAAVAIAATQMAASEVSPYMHAPSALCAHSVQSDAAATLTTTAVQTRKRKRDDDADNDENDVTEGDERAYSRKLPAGKRTRRCARAAMQTTAAVVVGAVAAWSALAFV